jgi:hypothetical protein
MSEKRHISRVELRKLPPAEVKALNDAGDLRQLTAPRSVSLDDLRTWDEDDIASAAQEGRPRHLGVQPQPDEAAAERARQHELLRQLSPAQIVRATRDGSLDGLLGRKRS